MAKLSLTDLASLTNESTAISAINNNNTATETAMEKTLSRDGTSPNEMLSNLDMNFHRLLNLPPPVGPTEPLRLQDYNAIIGADPSTTLSPVNPGNIYVAASGNDGNDGLSPSTAFATLQAAVTKVYTAYNLVGSDLTINIGAGTFAGAQINGRPPNAGNGGRLVIKGAGSGSTIINSTIIAAFGAHILLGSMTIQVVSGSCILAQYKSNVTLADSDLVLGPAVTALVNCYDHSSFLGSSFNLTISGGAQYGFLCSTSSQATLAVGGTLTLIGTPAFSIAFVDCINNSLFDPGFNSTVVGTATGPSYALGTNSVIDMENVTYKLPGTGYGTVATNATYYQPNFLAKGNTVYGFNTGQLITTGVNNSAFGYNTLAALITNASGTGATAVGANALQATTAINDAFGYKAGGALTTSTNNLAVGAFALGDGTALTGTGNNVALGYQTLRYLDNTANTNTAVGAWALSGSSGVHATGSSNVALGYNAGSSISTGSSNILIGANSALNAATDSSSIVIGTSTTGLGSNSLNIRGVIQSTGMGTPSTSVTTVLGLFSATAGLGYGTGSGGSVTQATSRTTGVTVNKPNGAITLFNAAPVVGTWVSFTVTNSTVAATDNVIVSVKSGTNTYVANVSTVAAGSFQISFNSIAGTAADSPVINFAVIKGVIT